MEVSFVAHSRAGLEYCRTSSAKGQLDRIPVVVNGGNDQVRQCRYSLDGSRFAYSLPGELVVCDCPSMSTVRRLPLAAVDFVLSPKGTYVATWEKPAAAPPAAADGDLSPSPVLTPASPSAAPQQQQQQHLNLSIWRISTGDKLASFSHKTQATWTPQWTGDESYFGRLVTGQVQFYKTENPAKGKRAVRGWTPI